MRAAALALFLPAVLVLSACGGDGDDETPTVPSSGPPPTAAGVRNVVRDYVAALNAGDGKRACAALDDRGKALVVAVLPSDQEKLGCEKAFPRVARQAVKLGDVEIDKIDVTGRSATATITAKQPSYSSGVLLAHYEDDGWKISYPPGLQTKSGAQPSSAPGVPLEQD